MNEIVLIIVKIFIIIKNNTLHLISHSKINGHVQL